MMDNIFRSRANHIGRFSLLFRLRLIAPIALFSALSTNVVYAQDNTIGADVKQQNTETSTRNASPSSASDEQPSSARAFDADSPMSWLKRMANAVEQYSFELTFVLNTESKDTLPYLWRKGISGEGEAVEQLSLLNGPGFEQIAFGDRVSIYEPGTAPHSVPGYKVKLPMPEAIIRDPEKLTQSYDIILMGRNRITGLMARQIRIVSKDQSRYGYYLWVDEKTGMPLKLNTYDLEGQLLTQVQVTALNVSDTVDRHFESFQANHLPELTPPLMLEQQQLTWALSYLPEGMKVVKKSLHRISKSRQPTEYMLLSDGVVDVSVYLLEANAAISDDIAWQMGQNSVVSKTDGRVQVSVIGNIPVATADKIANSIVLLEQPE